MTDDARPISKAKCGICGKPVAAEFRPFCSARCKQIDLGRWLNESYRVPAVEQDEDAADEDDSGSN
jgi:endogenous inhibitor of DNA gyrase (YacG/DUF329 family)